MNKILWTVVVTCAVGNGVLADEPQPANRERGKNQQPAATQPAATQPAATQPAATQPELYRKFTEQMNGVKLVGRFTIIGRENGPLAKEEYTIQKVEKLSDGDKWLIHARIKYGDHDLAIPLPLDVKWAGNTAVITLDNLTIPTLGTFSSRVVIDDGKYAGTWKHDKVGGHLFGTIEKLTADPESAPVKDR